MDKIETGNCILSIQKKFFVNIINNKKILVSNGKSLVIKTKKELL